MKTERWGIDFGRVISGGDTDDVVGKVSPIRPSMFGTDEQALLVPQVSGAFDVVRRIVKKVGKDNVFVVSKCGENVERKTLLWMTQYKFSAITGVELGNVRFVRKRPEKADVAKKLGLTHFVDDRADVLECLDGIVPMRYLFGPQKDDIEKVKQRLGILHAGTWEDLALLAQVPR